MTTRNPTWVAEDYRFYADTGSAGSTALAAQNTAAVVQNSAKFRLRVAVGETNNANTANVGSWVLQYILNGAAAVTVGAATAVKYTTSDAAAFVDGSTLTQALGGVTGSATYQSSWSEQDETGAVASQTWTDDDTEYEYCLQLNGTSAGDTITFRMLSPSSSTATTFTNVPTLRVPVDQSSTFTGSPTFYAGQADHQIPQASLFTSSPTFYGGAVSGDQTVDQSSTFTSSPVFYAGVVGQDASITQDSLFTASPTFYGGTVVQDPQGRYFGRKHYGPRYFGKRYWGTLTPTSIDGSFFGHRFFGGRFFGKTYWAGNGRVEPFVMVIEQTVALSGTTLVGGDVLATAAFEVAQTANLALTGTTAIFGDPSYDGEEFDFTPPLEITELSGTVTLAGDLSIAIAGLTPIHYFGQRYWGARYFGKRYWGTGINFPLVQSAAVGLTGTTGVAGAITLPVAMVQTNTIGLTGTVGVAGGEIVLNAVVSTGPVPAGKPKRRRKKTEVEIDGQIYHVETKEDATRLLETAKQAAEELAALAIERASKAERRPTRKVLADARKALQVPVIDADEDLQSEVEALQQEIADIYTQALQTVEIAALMRKAEIEEDDEDVLLLLS
jgi:hypothetical protein